MVNGRENDVMNPCHSMTNIRRIFLAQSTDLSISSNHCSPRSPRYEGFKNWKSSNRGGRRIYNRNDLKIGEIRTQNLLQGHCGPKLYLFSYWLHCISPRAYPPPGLVPGYPRPGFLYSLWGALIPAHYAKIQGKVKTLFQLSVSGPK